MQIRQIEKITGVPETTIRNWKFNYSNIYGNHKNLDENLKKEILDLVKKNLSIPQIAKELRLGYDQVRRFLKQNMGKNDYALIKISNRKLPEKSKRLTPELAYILGVMYGDGHFAKCQIRLGTKDRDFLNYFAIMAEAWSGKPLSVSQFLHNNKPYYECYLSFKEAADFIEEMIGKKRDKEPTIMVNTYQEDLLTMFIKGLSDSEGTFVSSSKSRSHTLKIYNSNVPLLVAVRDMFIKLGFDENKIRVVFNNKAKNGDVYAVKMSYKDQLKMFY